MRLLSILAVLVAAIPAGASTRAVRAACRTACATVTAQCVAAGGRRSHCRHHWQRRCRKAGPGICLVQETTTTTTTTSTTTTSTTTLTTSTTSTTTTTLDPTCSGDWELVPDDPAQAPVLFRFWPESVCPPTPDPCTNTCAYTCRPGLVTFDVVKESDPKYYFGLGAALGSCAPGGSMQVYDWEHDYDCDSLACITDVSLVATGLRTDAARAKFYELDDCDCPHVQTSATGAFLPVP